MFNWEKAYANYVSECKRLNIESRTQDRMEMKYDADQFQELINYLQSSNSTPIYDNCSDQDGFFEQAIGFMIGTIGEDVGRPGLKGTPDRIRRMWNELYGGYKQDPRSLLRSAIFPNEGSQEMIIVEGIDFYSTCEHHLMPFWGRVHIGYIPGKAGVIGLSKIPRAVNVLARRMQIQEKLGRQIAELFMDKDEDDIMLGTAGVIVCIEARHMCVEARGVKNSSHTVTVHREGLFRENHDLKHEFLSLIKTGGRL